MNCPTCGEQSQSASRVCPFCGSYMGRDSLEAVKSTVPVYYDGPETDTQSRPQAPGTGASRRNPRRNRAMRPATRRPSPRNYRARMVNWAMVALIAAIVLVVAAAGGFLYLQLTTSGQLTLARMGKDAGADGFWALGTEYLDRGTIARAIEAYEKALSKQPEREDLKDKLFMLAEAYEAGALAGKAEEVYTRIFTQLDPASVSAYRNVIRLMLADDRLFEATSLMLEAYEKTGDESFHKSRAALVPLPPEADLSGGRYLLNRKVSFVSPQEYDVYYAKGDEVLPEEGTLFTTPILLTEGTHEFRAVCVSSQLVSDEMSVRYVIALPVPVAPKATLAAGEYDRKQRVSLRNLDEEKDLEMYYTIDGSTPSQNSPRYEGVPIVLPGGRVTLRAIAVNSYGKVSNELLVQYRINIPYKKYFRFDDQFRDLTLLKTRLSEVVSKYGAALETVAIEDDAVGGECVVLRYAWGEARFSVTGEDGFLYYLRTEDPSMIGPRGTKVGMAMAEVTDKFRDMGQLPNDRGDRGIYYDLNEGYAVYEVLADDPGQGMLEYMYLIPGDEPGTATLRYDIRGEQVAGITLGYISSRVSNYR